MTRKLRRKSSFCFIFALLSVLSFQSVQAQEYPTKPVTLVIPLSAGGSHDLTARAVITVAKKYLGQPIVILNKPGGGGAIGTEAVANAAPDGYTLLLGWPGSSTTLPAVMGRSKGPDDFVPVCLVNYSTTMIVARSDLPYKTFNQFLDWTKANPGKLVFGTTGVWGNTDVAWKQIAKLTGVSAKVVPYDGGGPVVIAFLGDQIDATGMAIAPLLAHVKTGKLRILATLGDKREGNFPDVPTARELGVDVVNHNWRGVMAPKGTPRPIVEKLALAFKKMTEDKAVIDMIREQLGDEMHYKGPEEFAKYWRDEYEVHKELGKLYKK
jgi:tripartite-type tricarboxylate transporter receptor subunit TctC